MSRPENKWEGSRIYDRAWAGIYDLILPEYSDEDVERLYAEGKLTQAIPFYRWLLAAMNDAHVVEVEHEQLAVLPSMEEEQAIEWAANARLPFDPLFIGYRDVDALAAEAVEAAEKIQADLLDASPAMALAQRLLREPYGDGFTVGALVTKIDPLDYLPPVMQIAHDGQGRREINEQPSAALTVVPFVDIDAADRAGESGYHSARGNRIVHAPGAYCLSADTGEWACLLPHGDDSDDDGFSRVEGVIASGTKVACEVAYFLESYNVELVEQEVSRQVRRNAERRDKRISLVVHVRHPKSRAKPERGNGAKRDFSHRFEVRGHYKHFPQGTKMADSIEEEKLTHVPGRGLCRKVWCPPFVKGPTDRPLIPKVRIVHEEEK
jgi:hypothetical protein